jgi:voltage-gated potassium channel Kch
MNRPVTFGDKLRYHFENTLSRGPIAIIGWLAILSLAIVLVAAVVVSLFGIPADPEKGEKWNFIEAAWNLLMRTFDAGNMADDSGWALRFVTLLVTIGGIFIVSTLIGTITSGMEASIDEMRKGRSRVIESGHTLILGWSPKVFTIVSELVIANENQKKPRIVILADHDKVEMEDEVRAKLPDTKNTRVICRRGSPLDLDDLDVVNPHEAKSIIILSPESENPDTHVIKSILALTNNPHRRKEPYHIVAEIRDLRNMEAARLVGGDEAVLILSADVIARVTAQTCRQSGLSVVYQELMDFDGAEIYFKEEPALAGRTYREALSHFESSTMIGVMTASGQVLLNPAMTRPMAAGDKVVVIAEDDDTIHLTEPPPPRAHNVQVARDGTAAREERTLLIGWNEKARNIIREMDGYVGDGSHATVLCERGDVGPQLGALQESLQRQCIDFMEGDTTELATLIKARPETFDHIILLSDTSSDIQQADARTLITLLHLRNLAQQAGRDFSIVSEMLDIRNRALAEIARADDFIVSDKLISLLLAQISENKHLDKVFTDLFDPDGSEIYLKPITNYVPAGEPLNFYTLVEAAADRGETAIGYRIAALAHDSSKAYGVAINPSKNASVTFAAEDKLVVLAED